MTHFRDLNGYEKAIVVTLIVLFAVFTVLYAFTTSRVGYAYMETILVRRNENGNTIYAGEINHKEASFTVSSDGCVTFVYGGKTYGPYTVKEDTTAIPLSRNCTHGIEVRDKEEIIFRGGYFFAGNDRLFYNEDGSPAPIGFTTSSSNGNIVTDANGNIIDTMKPSIYTILELTEGPKSDHQGSWGMWVLCSFLSVFTVISVIFADALFRLRLSFRVQDVDTLEPSGWELDRRIICWGVYVFLILILYIVGLQ